MNFQNTYEDTRRATAYDELDLGGTYHLVFRELPGLLAEHVVGRLAVDFGCGTGRSTRFLRQLGFETVGLDISAEMIDIARQHDPAGDYRVIDDGDFSSLATVGSDLVLSAFTFDNIPVHPHRVRLFMGLRELLRPEGRMVNIVSTPEMYTNEWFTFSTRDFPENRAARPGEIVRIVTTDYSDSRPVDDILWPHESYQAVYRESGLDVEKVVRPLAFGNEGIPWVSETKVPPWAIYILKLPDGRI